MTDDFQPTHALGRRSVLSTLTAGATLAAMAPPTPGPDVSGVGPVRSLLDFIPYGQIAPIREGRSTWDAADAINRGIRDMGPGAIISPSAATYMIGQPLELGRGTALRHLGSFDDTPGRGAIIRLLPGANCAAIRTPAATAGEPTHFTCLEGFCIDGAKAAQTSSAPNGIVQWWGEFVGSEVRRVMIKDTLGPGMTLGRGADVLIEHLWIVGACLPDGGYAFDTNPGASGDTRGGLLTMTHVFVENPSVAPNGAPRHQENDRANAVRFHRLAAAHVGRMHIEGARRSLSIQSCDQVDIGLLSGIWLGHSADRDRSFVDLVDAGTKALRIGALASFAGDLPLVRKRVGVNSDSLPDLEARGYGMNLGYAATNDMGNGMAVAPATCFTNALAVEAVGATGEAKVELSVPTATPARSRGYIGLTPDRLEIGAPAGSHVAIAAPVVVGDAAPSAPVGALVRQGGTPSIARAGRTSDPMVTLRLTTHAPTGAPDAVGILLCDRVNRRSWLSVGTSAPTDWLPFQ